MTLSREETNLMGMDGQCQPGGRLHVALTGGEIKGDEP